MDSAQLLSSRFRLSSSFRILELSSMTAAEREALGGIRIDAGVAFALLPETAGPPAKVVDAGTATVLRSLAEPRVLGSRDWEAIPREPAVLAGLVVDGVLELELEDRFVSGPGAAIPLGLDSPHEAVSNACSEASLAALAYAARLDGLEPASLSRRLYQFGRQPVSPAWRAEVADAGGPLAWLGLGPRFDALSWPDGAWGAGQVHAANPEWLFFRRGRLGDRRLKLYVAPDPSALRASLPAVVSSLAEHHVRAFKIGRTCAALRRPDKLVAYLDSRDQLEALSADVLRLLPGVPAQPVPFSAGLDAGGVTSWGIDPPSDERVSRLHGLSWRRWVTDRLAVALTSARVAGIASPVDFARQRMRLDGVDPTTWAPTGVSWAVGLG